MVHQDDQGPIYRQQIEPFDSQGNSGQPEHEPGGGAKQPPPPRQPGKQDRR